MRRKKHRRSRFFSPFKLALLAALFLAAGSLYTPYPAALLRSLRGGDSKVKVRTEYVEKQVLVPVQQPKEEAPDRSRLWSPDSSFAMPEIVLPPFPPALPETVADGDYSHVNKLANGVSLRSNVHFVRGSTATQDRTKKAAYQVKVSLDLLLPHAANGQELLLSNPQLRQALAGYDGLMAQAQVSPWFHALYLHKQNYIRKNAATLSRLLDRHNFFDTDSILEIKAPSGRRVLWMQADMDVVSDGSDGDRLPTMPATIVKSDHYQATTSYRWKKRSQQPNPLLARWQDKLTRLQKSKDGKPAQIAEAKRLVAELKSSSFLLAEYDPFIVLPLTLNEGKNNEYHAQPGDYVAVIVGKRVFPAIVGDYGPRYKSGEASLRLGKAVNPKTTVYARALSNLEASYLIFPSSKEKENGPIDYDRLNSRVQELLQEIGGLGPQAEFVPMVDLLKKPEPPAPAAAAPSLADEGKDNDATPNKEGKSNDAEPLLKANAPQSPKH